MAKSKIQIAVETKGSQKAAKDIESVGRAQTRLGQASASTSRQFSAQASGLGGFVAAYAGAAANIFALQQAFAALQRVAQFETVVAGTKALAAEIGVAGNDILATVGNITQGQIALEEAAQNINIALSAGLGGEQIERLTDISFKASRALGRNLTDSLQRVVRGTAKLEPELLDELGIFARIDPAVEAYAAKLNVAASSLTNYEKRQAFANAVIEEGEKKFSSISTTADTTQASLEKFIVQIQTLAIQFGQLIAGALKPFIDFLSVEGNAVLAFGAVIALVFGKAAQVIGGFAAGAIANLSAFTAKLADVGTAGSAGALAALQSSAATGVKKEGIKGLAIRGDSDAAVAARAGLDQMRKGSIGTFSELNKVNQALKDQIKTMKVGTTSYDRLNAQIVRNDLALKGAGLRTRAFIRIANTLNISVRGLAIGFGMLKSVVSGLFAFISIAQLAGTILGIDFLGELKEMISGVGQEVEDLKTGLAGVAVAAAGGGAAVQDRLRLAGVAEDEIKKFSETLKDDAPDAINNAFNDILTAVKNNQRNLRDASFLEAGIFNQLSEKYRKYKELRVSGSSEEIQAAGEVFRQAMKTQSSRVAEAAATDDSNTALAIAIQLNREAAGAFGKASQAIGRGARAAGVSAEQAAAGLRNIAEEGQTVEQFLEQFAIKNKRGSVEVENVNKKLSILGNVLKSAEDSFEGGSASAETLSKKLLGIRKILEFFGGDNFDDFPNALDKAATKAAKLEENLRQLKIAETISKGLTDNFGKFIKLVDQAAFTNVLSSKEGDTAAKRQASLLQNIVMEGQKLQKLKDKGKTLDALQNRNLENGVKAAKILTGLQMGLPKEIEKQAKAQEKIRINLEGQLSVLRAQNDVKSIQQDISETQASDRRANTAAQEAVKLLEAQKKLQEELGKAKQQELDFQRQMNQLNQDALMQQRALAEIGRAGAAAGAQGARKAGIRGSQAQLADMQAFPNLNTLESIRQKQEEIINKELDNQLKIIAEKERVARFEAETAREILREAIRQNMNERAAKQEELATLVRVQEQERVIAAANAEMERNKVIREGKALKVQADLIAAQTRAAQAQNDAREANRQFQVQQANQQLDALRVQVEVVDQLAKVLGPNTAFVKAITEFIQLETGRDITSQLENLKQDKIKADFDNLDEQIKKNNALARQGYLERNQALTDEFSSKMRINQLDQSANSALLTNIKKRQTVEAQIATTANATARTALENEATLLTKKIEGQFKEFNIIDANEKAKLEGLAREKTSVQDNAEARQAALDRERDSIRKVLDDISEKIQNRLGGAVEDFFGAIREGTLTMENFKQGVKDLFVGILEDVTTSVTEEFVINPIKEFVKEGIGNLASMFGGGPSPQQAVVTAIQQQTGVSQQIAQTAQGNLKDIFDKQMNIFEGLGMDVQRVQVVGGIGGIGSPVLVQDFADPTGSSLDLAGQTAGLRKNVKTTGQSTTATDKNTGAVVKSTEAATTQLDATKGVTAAADTAAFSFENLADFAGMAGAGLGALAGGLIGGPAGSVVGSIVGMIAGQGIKMLAGSLFGPGAAAGGPVRRMASGGALRDRVPAMLEPGEFVIRKPMAKAIGGPALNAMNAHGTMPNNPNVVVNMNNTGTAQESEGKPRVSVTPEAIIVDIVTRDMQNNGPIRRSIRGNLS